jgi:hypothetical protein
MGLYLIIAFVYGAVCYLFVRFFLFFVLWITHTFLRFGFLQENEKLQAIWPEPDFVNFFGAATSLPTTGPPRSPKFSSTHLDLGNPDLGIVRDRLLFLGQHDHLRPDAAVWFDRSGGGSTSIPRRRRRNPPQMGCRSEDHPGTRPQPHDESETKGPNNRQCLHVSGNTRWRASSSPVQPCPAVCR